MKIVRLNSVGSAVDVSTGIIYPLTSDNKVVTKEPIDLNTDEINTEWWLALSPEDFKIVKKYYKK